MHGDRSRGLDWGHPPGWANRTRYRPVRRRTRPVQLVQLGGALVILLLSAQATVSSLQITVGDVAAGTQDCVCSPALVFHDSTGLLPTPMVALCQLSPSASNRSAWNGALDQHHRDCTVHATANGLTMPSDLVNDMTPPSPNPPVL
ncbi:hypothetical protein BCR34DRAFT_585282 [Clohesyomyces aquaticus]|uniref:Uncharacterized protein n=1 Tax=Clohesyomyces aquaticus TaxID=1231657 RepID=A0A1Y1ZZF5_9PLEO|nr:hypothetical protein BCR34DRAFT_585282 [Clohesyomyces aquaticus]